MLGTRRSRATAAALLALVAAQGLAGEVELRAANQALRISTDGGLPTRWIACDAPCARETAARRVLIGAGEGTAQWVSGDAAVSATLARIAYRAETSENADSVVAVLTAVAPLDGRTLVQRYEISRSTGEVRLRLEAPPGAGLRLATGAGFIPEPLPGFGAGFGDVEAVRVSAEGQEALVEEPGATADAGAARDEWLGIRARFWAWLSQPVAEAETRAVAELPEPNRPTVTWRAPAGDLQLRLYAGPIEWKSLRVVAPELAQMLFAALWEPLRWLCFGLLALLGFITRWIEDPGVAIVLLSLAVKFILYPLTRIADRWQQDVNRIQGRLQPRLESIKHEFRGEEAHRLTLAAYREEGVHPLFTLKSLAGFAIQVPMFIAAFDMLADNYALAGARFLWIDDLAAPDRFAALPVALPFFGAHFNLLPLMMTTLTVLSAVTQKDESLTPALLKKQQRQLYLMAGGFFLLFYTFPAGMVLYWTANNFWHFVKVQIGGLYRRN
jgi:YidC/Oxa1 family membrane protein insertase